MNPRPNANKVHYLVALLVSLLFLLPLYWMFTASLREQGLPPPTTIEWWPAGFHWENYRAIFELIPLASYIGNSTLVVAAAVPLTLLTAGLAGFGLSQLPNPLRTRLVNLSMGLLIVPAASVWLFRFQILGWLGLIDTLWALIIPAFAASNPLFVLLYYWTFNRVPSEIFEAARLEGASFLTVCWHIARPVARPTTIAITLLTFTLYWSDFVSPILYIFRTDLYTLPIGLQLIRQLDSTNWPLLMAVAALMTAPILLLFLLLQRHFLSDLSLANLTE